MMNLQRVQISSDDFLNNSSRAWKQLWDTRDFSDVTLVSEDGFRSPAHKAVLSFSSSFFSEVLRENPHPSPLIYLRGVKQAELQFLLEFIYTGQSHVEQNLLGCLLSVGQDLGVQGLLEEHNSYSLEFGVTQNEKVQEKYVNADTSIEKANKVETSLKSVFDENPVPKNKDRKNDHTFEDSKEEMVNCGVTEFLKQTSSAILEDVKNNELDIEQEIVKTDIFICDQCDFQTSTIKKLNLHSQSKHFGTKYPCDLCDFKATQQQGLRDHRQRKHGIIFQPEPKQPQFFNCGFCSKELQTKKGLRLHLESKHGTNDFAKCEKCDFKTAIVKNLFNHVQSVHEGVRYSCQHCAFKATTKGNLTVHTRTKHEGRRYKCDQCDHSVTSFNNLTNHKKSKHEENANHKCDQCNYQLKTKQRLKIHIMTMHKGIWNECDICSYRSISAAKLKQHKESKHFSGKSK